MNKADIEKLTQCFSDFARSMKGAVLEDELLKFHIILLNDGYKIEINKKVALEMSRLIPEQWIKKHTDYQDLIKEVGKMIVIRGDDIVVESDCALFIAFSLYIKTIKNIKRKRIIEGKEEIEEKLPEVMPQKIYNAVKNYVKIYYSEGSFRAKIRTLGAKTDVPVPRIKKELKSTKPKELIEEIRQIFKSVSPK